MAHKKFTIEEIRKWIESNPKKYLSDDMDYYFHIYPQEITEESIIKANQPKQKETLFDNQNKEG